LLVNVRELSAKASVIRHMRSWHNRL